MKRDPRTEAVRAAGVPTFQSGKPAGDALLREAAYLFPLEAYTCPRLFHVIDAIRKAAMRLGRTDMQARALADDVTEAFIRFVKVRPEDFGGWVMHNSTTFVAAKLRLFAAACADAMPGPDDLPLTEAEFASLVTGADPEMAVAA